MRLQQSYRWHVDELPSVLLCSWPFMTVAFSSPCPSWFRWRNWPGSKPNDLGLCMANYHRAWQKGLSQHTTRRGLVKMVFRAWGSTVLEDADKCWVYSLNLYFFRKKTSLLSFFGKKKKKKRIRGCGCAFELCCSREICERVSGKEAISVGSAASLIASGPKAGLRAVLGSHRFQGCFYIRMLLLVPWELADSPRSLFPCTLIVRIHASLLLIPYGSRCARNSTCKAIQLIYIHNCI